MGFWNNEKIKEALADCKLYNFPENWTSTGLKIWHENLGENDIVFCRSKKDTRGVAKAFVPLILPKISAIMCTDYENYKEFCVPIIEVPDFTKALFDMGRYARRFYKGTSIVLTGSAGKSTTTKMIYDVLEEYGVESNLNLANTLIAVCWNMTNFDINKKYWVIESSIGFGYVASANIAVITNLAAVHLKEGQTIEEMAKGKSKIFATMRAGDVAILNREMECYEIFETAAQDRKLKIITVGERAGVDIRILPENCFAIKGDVYQYSEEYVPKHLLYDIASTIAVTYSLGLSIENALEKLQNFQCLKGRGETLSVALENKKITLVDEAFNANPLSMKTTIESFGKKYNQNKVLILGDMAEGGDNATEQHLALLDTIKQTEAKRIILCGAEMKNLFNVLKLEFECHYYENSKKLLMDIKKLIDDNDNVFVKSSHSTGLYQIVNMLKTLN